MQTVERTFAILRALASTEAAGVSEVARTTDLPKSTVHRILASLETQGIVLNGGDGRYSVGPGLADLTRAVSTVTAIRHVSRPFLDALVSEFDEASGITVVDGRFAHYVEHVASEGAVQTRNWSGMRLPLHTVAGGLALMAQWSPSEVVTYAEKGLVVNTEATAASLDQLEAKLNTARRNGHIWTFADFDKEINGVAAAIVGSDGSAAASISLYGPAYRFPGGAHPATIGQRLADVAATISGKLDGGR